MEIYYTQFTYKYVVSQIKGEHLVTVKAVKRLKFVIILIPLVVEYNYVHLFKCCTYIKLM